MTTLEGKKEDQKKEDQKEGQKEISLTKIKKKSSKINIFGLQCQENKNTVILKRLGLIKKKEYRTESIIGNCDSHISDVKGHIYACNLTKDDLMSSQVSFLRIYFWRHYAGGIDANLLTVDCLFVPTTDLKENEEVSGKFKFKLVKLTKFGGTESTIIDAFDNYPGNKAFLLSIPNNQVIKEMLETQLKNFLSEINI